MFGMPAMMAGQSSDAMLKAQLDELERRVRELADANDAGKSTPGLTGRDISDLTSSNTAQAIGGVKDIASQAAAERLADQRRRLNTIGGVSPGQVNRIAAERDAVQRGRSQVGMENNNNANFLRRNGFEPDAPYLAGFTRAGMTDAEALAEANRLKSEYHARGQRTAATGAAERAAREAAGNFGRATGVRQFGTGYEAVSKAGNAPTRTSGPFGTVDEAESAAEDAAADDTDDLVDLLAKARRAGQGPDQGWMY